MHRSVHAAYWTGRCVQGRWARASSAGHRRLRQIVWCPTLTVPRACSAPRGSGAAIFVSRSEEGKERWHPRAARGTHVTWPTMSVPSWRPTDAAARGRTVARAQPARGGSCAPTHRGGCCPRAPTARCRPGTQSTSGRRAGPRPAPAGPSRGTGGRCCARLRAAPRSRRWRCWAGARAIAPRKLRARQRRRAQEAPGDGGQLGVDALGQPLALTLTPADEQVRAQAGALAAAVQEATGDAVEVALVNSGDTGDMAAEHASRLAEGKRPEARRGSVLLPRTVGRGARLRLDGALPPPGPRRRAAAGNAARASAARLHHPHAQTVLHRRGRIGITRFGSARSA